MGIFSFFKKNKESKNEDLSMDIILAMPMFINGSNYNLNALVDDLRSRWGLDVTDLDGDSAAATFNISKYKFALGALDVPIPVAELQGTAAYAYNWPNAMEQLKDHTGHAIVSLLAGGTSQVDRYAVFSKVLCSVLFTSDTVGIYQGSQSLLIPAQQYINAADALNANAVPVNVWVYIGLVKTEDGNCAYTYGLKEFGKQELEVINSSKNLEQLYEFIWNIVAYLIGNDVTLKSGETLGSTEDEKIAVTASKGRFTEGTTLKLELR